MPELLRMPEIAAATTSAVLAGWPVAVNTRFSASDVIATVETDKAVVDVEAESDGVILRTLVTEGTEVEVGTAIAVLARTDEQVDDVDAALAALGVSAGNGAAPTNAPAPQAAPPAGNGAPRRFASPLARRLAAEAGLLVTDLVGTGPGGRIVRRDVEAALAQRVAHEEADVHDASPALPGPAAPALEVPSAPAPVPAPSTSAGYTDQPLSRMRKAVAARLTESKATAPHFYLSGAARVDALLQLREDLNDGADVRVSVNDLLVKAVAKAHLLVPEMNVVWTEEAVLQAPTADVAVAVASERGLVTPVIPDVDSLSIAALSARIKDVVARSNTGKLQQSELDGGTLTVSNLGMYGIEEFDAILNPPQAGILAVGAASKRPVVGEDGELGTATIMNVVLSVDHRPVDGAIGAKWLGRFREILENPLQILL